MGVVRWHHARVGVIQRAMRTANILSSTLIQMAPELKARLARPGFLVLAGILRREAESVLAAYLPEVCFVGARNSGAWTALIFGTAGKAKHRLRA